ncbi:putative beta-adaptin, partial [Dimargaris cristalligena]
MSDAKYFQRGKLQELRAELLSEKRDAKYTKKRIALKKIVANMTMGNDMAPLCTEVIACMTIPSLEIKKMVYLYLVNYGRNRSEIANLALQHMLQDANDHNPLIRAQAIRTMSYLYVDRVIDALCDPLRHSLKDSDPYVRKTAALCVVKLCMYDRSLVEEEQFIDMLKTLLSDSNPAVVANAVAALTEISECSPNIKLRLNLKVASKLIQALNQCSEWGQTYILEALMFVVPQEEGDAEMVAERIIPRLQHANAAVVLTAVKLIVYLMNYMTNAEFLHSISQKLAPPLVTLLNSRPEVQYVALRNILIIIQRRPTLLNSQLKSFFCKYNDPIYVKLAKLEILIRLTSDKNYSFVLPELQEYAAEVDVDFVRKAVRSIGRLAIKIDVAAERCIEVLLDLIRTKVNYVVQEAVVVIKDIFRKYPNRYESIIGILCENLDSLDDSDAKAAMIWIIGQYADRIDNSDEVLEGFLDTFLEEPTEVQLALLTATVKLFIKRPTLGQELVPKVLKWATEEVDNPDLRDRGYIYWRLLSTDPEAAKEIILSDKPDISAEAENLDPLLLEELLLNISSLAAVYHKPPATFIPGAKRRLLPASKVL